MATADDIILPKGTILEVEDKTTPDTWIKVEEPMSIPAIPLNLQKEYINVTSLSDTSPKFKATEPDELPDMSITCQYVEGDQGQTELQTSAAAGEVRNLRITIPGKTQGLLIPLLMGQAQIEPAERGSALQITFNGKLDAAVTEVSLT